MIIWYDKGNVINFNMVGERKTAEIDLNVG